MNDYFFIILYIYVIIYIISDIRRKLNNGFFEIYDLVFKMILSNLTINFEITDNDKAKEYKIWNEIFIPQIFYSFIHILYFYNSK